MYSEQRKRGEHSTAMGAIVGLGATGKAIEEVAGGL